MSDVTVTVIIIVGGVLTAAAALSLVRLTCWIVDGYYYWRDEFAWRAVSVLPDRYFFSLVGVAFVVGAFAALHYTNRLASPGRWEACDVELAGHAYWEEHPEYHCDPPGIYHEDASGNRHSVDRIGCMNEPPMDSCR